MALRRAILEYGLPTGAGFRLQILMENGADFRSLPIEMALAHLQIDRHFCHVQNAQGKTVERFFKTFDDHFARFEASYTGEKPENRPPTTAFYEKNPGTFDRSAQRSSQVCPVVGGISPNPHLHRKQKPLRAFAHPPLAQRAVGGALECFFVAQLFAQSGARTD